MSTARAGGELRYTTDDGVYAVMLWTREGLRAALAVADEFDVEDDFVTRVRRCFAAVEREIAEARSGRRRAARAPGPPLHLVK